MAKYRPRFQSIRRESINTSIDLPKINGSKIEPTFSSCRESHSLTRLIKTFASDLKFDDWSYEGECGPQTWDQKFTNARGKYQSPINIVTKLAEYDRSLDQHPLVIDYDHHSCSIIKNTGHTFQVDSYPSNLSTVSGGPSHSEFSFLQFHMHWGDTMEKGSEHLINGMAYSAELHFVNWNHDIYKDSKIAANSNKSDGLLILAVLIKTGRYNQEFETLFESLEDIHLKDKHLPVQNINMIRLMPDNLHDYWTYAGSLTTPPCSESVQWVIFREPVEISADQLDKCHLLYSVCREKRCNEKTIIRFNNRPVCSMGDRIVRKSFKN